MKTRLERLWLRDMRRRPRAWCCGNGGDDLSRALLTIVGLALAGAIMMMAQLQLNTRSIT